MKNRIYKYGTGEKVPNDAIYLGTVTQTKKLNEAGNWADCFYVWHYFLVETED